MDVACLFAWSGASMLIFRFLQGIGTGGEVPVASAYINEFISAKKRGRFFLLYEVIFPVGLLFAGLAGYFLVPLYGWQALFVVGLVPAVLMIPLRMLMPESPRWLASRGLHREGRQGRLHARAGSGQGRQAAARAGRPSHRRQGHREVRLARAVPGHLPEAHADDLGPLDQRLCDQQRSGHLAAHALPAGVQAAAGHEPRSTAGSPRPSVSSPPSCDSRDRHDLHRISTPFAPIRPPPGPRVAA